LTDAVFAERLKQLRIRPIRGGTFDRDGYVSGALERWGEWEAEKKLALLSAGKGPRSGFQGVDGPAPRPRLPGLPAWVYERHKKIADHHGIDLKRAVLDYGKQCSINPSTLPPCDVFGPFEAYLLKLAQRREREHDNAAE
jgi:hypothetical protein